MKHKRWIFFSFFFVILFLLSVVLLIQIWPFVSMIPAKLEPEEFNGVGVLFVNTFSFLPFAFWQAILQLHDAASAKRFVADFPDDKEESNIIRKPEKLEKASFGKQLWYLLYFRFLNLHLKQQSSNNLLCRIAFKFIFLAYIVGSLINSVFWLPSLIFDLYLQDIIPKALGQFGNIAIVMTLVTSVRRLVRRILLRHSRAKRHALHAGWHDNERERATTVEEGEPLLSSV